MRKLLRVLDRGVEITGYSAGKLAAVLVGIITALVVIDVILRYFFAKPLRWGLDVDLSLMIALALLGIGYVQGEKAHISITLVTERLAPRVRKVVDIVTACLSAVLCGVLAWQGILLGNASLKTHEKTGMQIWPLAPFKYLVFVGFAIWCLMFIHDIVRLAAPSSVEPKGAQGPKELIP